MNPVRPKGLRAIRSALGPLVLLAAVAALLAQQHNVIVGSPSAHPKPWPMTAPPRTALDIGLTTAPLARDSWRAWGPSDLGSVNAFEYAAHAHADIIMWFADWRTPLSLAQLREVRDRHSIPEITWEPWNADDPAGASQPRYALRRIIAGHFDNYIRAWARGLAAYGGPVLLRFAQEMNGTWYPWDERANGNRPGEFIAMWRHVHRLFTLAGARNVRWVWSPVGGNASHYFPGRRWVNELGLTCLNGGTAVLTRRWGSFASVCAQPIAQLHEIAPEMPIQISEAGSSPVGGNKAAWITGMFAFLRQHPAVKSVIWFNLRKGTDWRIQSSHAAAASFALGLRGAPDG